MPTKDQILLEPGLVESGSAGGHAAPADQGRDSAVMLDEVPSGVVIETALRFIRGGRYRLDGPWADQLRGPLRVEAVDESGELPRPLWVACLGATIDVAGAVARAIDDVPADVREMLFAVRVEDEGEVSRVAADTAAVSRLLRRHLRTFDCVAYADMESESGWLLLPYERVNDAARLRYPADVLAVERNLHMDMTREAGRRSDAHLARYRFASERILAGARVLDCACGLGYGSAMIASGTSGRAVTGVDLSQWVVDYASVNFGHEHGGPWYRQGDASELASLADEGFEAVVSFETIEHLLDPVPFLRHVRRVLADDGIFIASVPYRWITDGDTGPYHHDWFDAGKFVDLCGRFLSVEELWIETAGWLDRTDHRVRGWRRHDVLGEEPTGDVEWVIIVARKRASVRALGKSWLLLPSDVAQLATMAAALPEWGVDASQAYVCGTADSWDDAYSRTMAEVSRAFGFHYGGHLPIPKELATRLPADGHVQADAGESGPCGDYGDAIRADYPVFDGLTDLNVVIAARPGEPRDYGFVAALRPNHVRLVDGGVQHEDVFRDATVMRGAPGNALARFPSDVSIVCPSWLASDTGLVGRARLLESSAHAAAFDRVRATPIARAFLDEIRGRVSPFTAVVIDEAFSHDGLTTGDVSSIFALHQVRALLHRTSGSVLFKAHPRNRHESSRLMDALHADRHRVRVMAGDEVHLPIEAFPEIAGGQPVHIWGTASAALLGCAAWDGAQVHCVDADYLEPEIRRRALQFSRRSGHPLLTLRANDELLGASDRATLRRRFLPSPALRREAELTERLHEAEQARRAARNRFELAAQRIDDFQRAVDEAGALGSRASQDAGWAAFVRLLLSGDDRPVWIWGSGEAGRRLLARLRRLHLEPQGFLDSRSWDEVRSVDRITLQPADASPARGARDARAFVIIASIYAHEILQRIRLEGDWRSTVIVWSDRH